MCEQNPSDYKINMYDEVIIMKLMKYKELLNSFLDSPRAKQIVDSKEFYFEKAIDKYNEYINLEVNESILHILIDKTKAKPFSYKKLLKEYSIDSIEYKILLVIGELVSYIDSKAAMKNELNQYEDKRTMALAFVRQNVWIQYLLSYKLGDYLESLPEMLRNALKYIQNPMKEISAFKEAHRQAIAQTFFDGQYNSIFDSMRNIGIKCKNPMNDGCLYPVIFYQEAVKKIWDTTISVEENEHKTWAYAPGENGYKWNEFREQGIMAIEWDEIGDLQKYKTKNDIIEQLNKLYEPDSKPTNDGLALWQFCNEIQVGDRIFAKAGSKTLLGVGEVISDYEYNDDRDEYKHIRKVNWLKAGEWILEDKFAIKTLTDITMFEEFCNKVYEIIEKDDSVIVETEAYTKQDFLSDVFISEKEYETIKSLIMRKKNIILQGPPGVGKTYAAKRLAYSLIGEKDESRIKMIQFHQSYAYEDFVMGYRPNGNGFELKNGPFYQFCELASENLDNDYYFIIDEINRGNMSKIFGELMMLIENDKRGEEIILTYSNKPFYVPENLYIIGMMNTADRSLAIIDYALRRRFCFVELEPAFESEVFKNHLLLQGASEELINKIKTRIGSINLEIEKDVNLGKGFRIGHSYFCNCVDTDKWYEEIIKYEIQPLIKEYWFDEEEKAKNYVEELLR